MIVEPLSSLLVDALPEMGDNHALASSVGVWDALLIVTIEVLAATLSLALPKLGVEIAGSEELAQTLTPQEKQPNAP